MKSQQWIAFQFPSNGKVFLNSRNQFAEHLGIKVSIPFKREGLSEHVVLCIE